MEFNLGSNRTQKLAMLALVANAVRTEAVPSPVRLTAVAEATVAAVFSLIRLHLAMEIETGR